MAHFCIESLQSDRPDNNHYWKNKASLHPDTMITTGLNFQISPTKIWREQKIWVTTILLSTPHSRR